MAISGDAVVSPEIRASLIGSGPVEGPAPTRVAPERAVWLGPECTKGTHIMRATESFFFEVVFRSSRRRAGK